jgi:uncharacterized protein (TIGR02246 family)
MTLKNLTIAAVDGRSGMATDDSAATAEDQIRALIEDRVKAVRAKDIIGAMSSSASDILSFDVVDPLQYVGLDALKKRLEGWYSSFQGPIGLEICELNITAGDEVAFSHSLNQVIGTKTDGKKIEMYWRATVCYRKVDGKWLVSHEHNSVSFDPESGNASLHLKP